MRRQDLDVRTDLSLLLHDLFALDRHDAQNVEIGQTMRQLSFARKVVFLASSLAGTNHHITCLFHNFPSISILDKRCRGTIQLVAPTKKNPRSPRLCKKGLIDEIAAFPVNRCRVGWMVKRVASILYTAKGGAEDAGLQEWLRYLLPLLSSSKVCALDYNELHTVEIFLQKSTPSRASSLHIQHLSG